jgi:hypothetical protein
MVADRRYIIADLIHDIDDDGAFGNSADGRALHGVPHIH